MGKHASVLKISNLIAFHSVVEHASFTRAAKFTRRSQGQLSQIVSAIEALCGCPLLIRTGSGVELNEAGRLFMVASQQYLDAYYTFSQGLSTLAVAQPQQVVLCAPPGVIHFLADHVMASLVYEHPEVAIALKKCQPGDVDDYDHLLNEADIVISFLPSQHPAAVNVRLELEMGFYANPSLYPLEGLQHPEDLLKERCITVENYGSESNAWGYWEGGEARRLEVSGKYQCHDAVSAISMASNGLGIVYIPKVKAMPHVEAGRLTQLLAAFSCRQPYYVIYKKSEHVRDEVLSIRSHILAYGRRLMTQ